MFYLLSAEIATAVRNEISQLKWSITHFQEKIVLILKATCNKAERYSIIQDGGTRQNFLKEEISIMKCHLNSAIAARNLQKINPFLSIELVKAKF